MRKQFFIFFALGLLLIGSVLAIQGYDLPKGKCSWYREATAYREGKWFENGAWIRLSNGMIECGPTGKSHKVVRNDRMRPNRQEP